MHFELDDFYKRECLFQEFNKQLRQKNQMRSQILTEIFFTVKTPTHNWHNLGICPGTKQTRRGLGTIHE